MTALERKLLLTVAKLLCQLIWWKNLARDDHGIGDLVKAVEQEQIEITKEKL